MTLYDDTVTFNDFHKPRDHNEVLSVVQQIHVQNRNDGKKIPNLYEVIISS